MKFWVFILCLVLCHASAQDIRIVALSQIESGDRDDAIGACGEVSRWQVLQSVWMEYAKDENPKVSSEAVVVVNRIINDRINHFTQRYHRQPTDEEYYLLWHRHARVLNPRINEKERAERFANLVRSMRSTQ
jgi:hypothetical protein